ncbi:heme ABC transporter ATP-binding protein [Aerobium aerolatum]|uniref:Iron complex transport system ATP-binding protein n=1 Tax=Aquamicrobium aerolatum DSM 21857 TaxID=1121003 RepID=A0A1I3KH76_9HYPH|nr:heme ABC transporter ATP-binding protein [Aquamicrobium aerolatum]SFI71754.1 iron complex transport system ATP-binding protein [Aquamicrobium aerolatum DSM 21857]
MIDATDVEVSIGSRKILHGINFTARSGEVTAIVGPNGSGKTTFMKSLSGDIKAKGSVRINGRDLRDLKPWQLAGVRAVLPQATSLSFPFTVREIVRLGVNGGRSGANAKVEDRLPEKALAKVDLEGFAGRYYQELSGGEQQRVQLARVLCQVWEPVLDGEPRWLFLDEPVSSLDIKHQLVIMKIAQEFAASGGGVVAILHDLNLTSMFADHVTVISRGTVAAAGKPAAVFTDELIEEVFECRLKVGVLPAGDVPFVLPQSAC